MLSKTTLARSIVHTTNHRKLMPTSLIYTHTPTRTRSTNFSHTTVNVFIVSAGLQSLLSIYKQTNKAPHKDSVMTHAKLHSKVTWTTWAQFSYVATKTWRFPQSGLSEKCLIWHRIRRSVSACVSSRFFSYVTLSVCRLIHVVFEALFTMGWWGDAARKQLSMVGGWKKQRSMEMHS